MSFIRKFAFLGEKSEGWIKWGKKKREVIRNPYTNRLQVTNLPIKSKTKKSPKMLQSNFTRKMEQQDQDWFGTNMATRKITPSTTRFLLYNPNGLPYRDTDFLLSLIRTCIENQVHYCSFTEINVNANNLLLKNKMKQSVESFIQNGLFHMHNTRVHGDDVEYQPGGIAAWFYGKLNRKFLGVSYDKHGRWISHHFGDSSRNIKIYTLYRVNNSSSSPGSGTAWEQQRLSLSRDNIYNNPRRQVIDDLLEQLKLDIAQGFSIMLMGDLNEGIQDREKTNEKLAEIGLLNVFEHKLPYLPKTHMEGSRAIDHVWITSDINSSVQACGYAPFYHLSPSDHRGLFLDIDFHQLFPKMEYEQVQIPRKTLKSTNPNRVAKYNMWIRKQWKQEKMSDKWLKIKADLRINGKNNNNVKTLNKLDKVISDMMGYAEQDAVNIATPMQNHWSVKLHEAAKNVIDWSFRVRQSLRLSKAGKIDVTELETSKQGESLAREELLNIRNNSKQYRDKCQTEQATALKEQMTILGVKGNNYIKMIQNTEKKSEQFGRIQKVLLSRYRKPTTCVWIPDVEEYSNAEGMVNIYDVDRIWNRVHIQDGKDIKKWKLVDNKFMVEKLLLQWQRKHFEQASETPLADPKYLALLSDPKVQQQILEGQFEDDIDLPVETSLLLQYMIRTVPTKIDHKTKFSEFTEYIRKAKEDTSCSPSGRHYAHYKALAAGNTEILYTIFDIFTTALEHDIILDRWKTAVTSLIEKKPGTPYIHKFRSIHIVEAELQFFTKIIFARRMMKEAEQAEQISDNQYGGRKDRQATSVVLNKHLYYDITKQTLTEAAFMDDDAKACFDRVIPQLSQIESQKWGVSYKAASLATQIIQQQQFYVKTGFGVSGNYYSYNPQQPIFGVGQGLGWSGPMWINTSDTICRVLNDYSGGMHFHSFDGHLEVKKKNDLFVDDTASGVTKNCIQPGNTVATQLAKDEQLHASLLFSAGHKLASQKCAWYLVSYRRKGSSYTHRTKQEKPAQLHIREGISTDEKKVQRLEPNEPHKTLGHWISPNGSSDRQKAEIKKKADAWSSKILTSKLAQEDTKLAYSSFLLPSIRYKLVSTNLTYKECDELMVRIKEILLNANGMHKNCDRNILFQPETRLGLNYDHWYFIKGIEKIKLFLLHMRRNDTTSNLLRITMSYSQMESGTCTPFLQTPYSKWGKYASATWLTDMWRFLEECGSEIEIEKPFIYQRPREKDEFFLTLIENSALDNESKRILNQIRIHLKIYTLSDIVQIDKRSTILPQVQQMESSRPSSFKWPSTPPLPSQWKTLWTNFLSSDVQSHLYTSPLGRWTNPSHQYWETTSNSDGTRIQMKGKTFLCTHSSIKQETSPALCLFPTDIWKESVLGFSKEAQQMQYSTVPPPKQRQNDWKFRNIGTALTTSNVRQLREAIKSGKCIGVSDGSLKHQFPAHAWCFADTKSEKIILQGAAPVDGIAEQITSFRAEACGLLAMVCILQKVYEDRTLQKHRVTLYSDGQSVITKLFKPVETKTKFMLENDVDIIIELRNRLKSLRNNVFIQYVPGHQDKHHDIITLPFTQQLNVMMDSAVEDFIEDTNNRPKRRSTYPTFHSMKAWLTNQNGILRRNIQNELKLKYSQEKWIEYSQRKFDFCRETRKMVASTEIGKALQKNKPTMSQSIKLLHGVHFTSEVRKRWGLSADNQCPLCSKKLDSDNHFLRCEHPIMKETQNSKKNIIAKFLNKFDSDHFLGKIILFLYTHSHKVKSIDDFPNDWNIPHELRIAIASQQDIGFHLFNFGIITNEFGKYHQENTTSTSHHRQASAWTQHLITTLMQISRETWALRCKILHAENESTLNRIYRCELWNHAKALKLEWWRFSPMDRSLIQVDENFFKTAPMRRISIWRQQITVAQATGFYQATDSIQDIRTFFNVAKPAQQRRPKKITAQQLIPTQVLYKQSKITSSPITAKPTRIPVTNPVRRTRSTIPTSRITKWLTKRTSKIKPVDTTIRSDFSDSSQSLHNFLVSVSSRSAGANVASRKIKLFN